jgi:glycosyltransferase involved in cell wall biosynthesis
VMEGDLCMALVSVGVPVYNGERYLAETLDSLLAQTFTDYDIVISDNASTDRTAEICRRYRAKDPRISYFCNDENIGGALNFRRVFELSRGPYFHAGSCDDLYHPQFLERCVHALERDSSVVLSYARTTMIDDFGQPLFFDRDRNCYIDHHGQFVLTPVPPHVGRADSPEMRFREVLWEMGWALPLSGLIRREALLRTSPYGNYFGADKVLLAELALHGRFQQVGEELFAKRVHQECSHYKNTLEKAGHECRGPRGVPQLRMLRDYLKMTSVADISVRQHVHCILTIAGIARRREVWRRLFVPGPDNYFGLSFASK